MRVYDTVKASFTHSYVKVLINYQEKVLHTQTADWLLTQEKSVLPSDHFARVMTKNKHGFCSVTYKLNQYVDVMFVLD